MLCPKCQTDNLHQSSIGLTVCLKCGYILQAEDQSVSSNQPQVAESNSSDPYVHNSLSDFVNTHEDAIYQSFEEPTGSTSVIDRFLGGVGSIGSGLTKKSRHYIYGSVAILVVSMIVLFGILGVQNSQGAGLLGKAKEQSQAFEYDTAHSTLEKAQKKWTFKSTKKAINEEIAKVEQWQKYRQAQTEGEEYLSAEDYSSAIALLEPITQDYPEYPQVQKDLELAYSKLGASGQTIATYSVDTTPSSTGTTVSVSAPSTYRLPAVVRPPTPPPIVQPPTPPAPTPPPINPIITNGMCTVDASQAVDIIGVANNIAAVCKIAFPNLETKLGAAPYAAPHKIVLTSSQTYTQNGIAYISASWLRSHTYDMATPVHQLSLIIQNYPAGYYTWITEGMADYMTFELGYSNSLIYSHCTSTSRYNTASNCTAAFIKYLINRYGNFGYNIEYINTLMHNQTYSDTIFIMNTGKSIEQHYAECLNYECRGGKLNP